MKMDVMSATVLFSRVIHCAATYSEYAKRPIYGPIEKSS